MQDNSSKSCETYNKGEGEYYEEGRGSFTAQCSKKWAIS